VFLDDPHDCRVDILDPPSGRHKKRSIPEAEPPFVRPVHDRDVGRLDALFVLSRIFTFQPSALSFFGNSNSKGIPALLHYVPFCKSCKEDIPSE
jgi:hypothetical protein